MVEKEEYPLRDECKRAHQKSDNFQDRIERQPDGALPKIREDMNCSVKRCHDRVDTMQEQKVGMGIFRIVIIAFISFMIGVYGYSYSIDKDQEDLATEEQVEKADSKLEQKIDNLRLELKDDLKDTERTILEAIKDIKNK